MAQSYTNEQVSSTGLDNLPPQVTQEILMANEHDDEYFDTLDKKFKMTLRFYPWRKPMIKTRSRYYGLGTVIKTYKDLSPEEGMCSGCKKERYGQTCPEFPDAQVVDKDVHRTIYSLVTSKISKTLSCYIGVQK